VQIGGLRLSCSWFFVVMSLVFFFLLFERYKQRVAPQKDGCNSGIRVVFSDSK
jgi:hypothetical protein